MKDVPFFLFFFPFPGVGGWGGGGEVCIWCLLACQAGYRRLSGDMFVSRLSGDRFV